MALLLQAHPVPGAKRGRFHAPVMTTERRALITTGKRGEDRGYLRRRQGGLSAVGLYEKGLGNGGDQEEVSKGTLG